MTKILADFIVPGAICFVAHLATGSFTLGVCMAAVYILGEVVGTIRQEILRDKELNS